MYSVEQNIENFIKVYSDDLENINWNIWSHNKQLAKFNFQHEAVNIELIVYLKRDAFDDFKTFDIQPITPVVNENNKLLIYYRE